MVLCLHHWFPRSCVGTLITAPAVDQDRRSLAGSLTWSVQLAYPRWSMGTRLSKITIKFKEDTNLCCFTGINFNSGFILIFYVLADFKVFILFFRVCK